MEETQNTGVAEVTIPGTDPSEEPTGQSREEAGAPQPEPTDGTESSGTETTTAETAPVSEENPFLRVKYNHEEKTLSEQEAARLAQIGMRVEGVGVPIDRIAPLYEKLDYLAAQRGVTPDELVESAVVRDEQAHRNELAERFGDDDGLIDDMMTLYRQRQKEKYEKILENRKSEQEKNAAENRRRLESRLADEFAELREEFPEIAEFAALPDRVKAEAAKGKDLLSCYLRFRHAEERRREAEKQTEARAAAAATGSVVSEQADEQAEAEKRFVAGLWNH